MQRFGYAADSWGEMRDSTPTPRRANADSPMIGRSPPFRELLATLEQLAPLPHPVLVLGETGTGKELAARTLHQLSTRPAGPLVPLNCAGVPETLAESELFGHVRGSFTGAHRSRAGAFSRAHTGTLFLDEVAELPSLVQAKLLRVLETGTITPVGSDTEVEVDVRIVAATCRDVERMVRDGRLREDLFHRLSVLPVWVPALRERPEDIPLLLQHFVAMAERELGRPIHLTEQAALAARNHHWSGNIRALRNAVLRAAALACGPIEPHHLLPAGRASDAPRATADAISVPRGDYVFMRRSLVRSVVNREGSIRRASRVLGVPRSTLGTWLRQ